MVIQRNTGMNKYYVYGVLALVILAIVISSNTNTNNTIQYQTLLSENYIGMNYNITGSIPLTIDPTALPEWPSATYNSSSMEYIITPLQDLSYTIVYNFTIRQLIPMEFKSNFAQKLYVGSNVVYGYLQTNNSYGLLANGSYIIKYKIDLTMYQIQEKINWGVYPQEFIVGWLEPADPSFHRFDFTVEVGYV